MMSRLLRRHSTSLCVGLTVCLMVGFLGACKQGEEPQKPAPQAAPAAPKAAPAAPQAAPAAPQAAAAAPQAQPAFHVTRVDLGNAIGADKKVAAPTVSFKPNDTIYASIISEGAAPNVALGVRWTFEDGQVVNESNQSIAPTGPAVTEFHIAKADGWPAGKYKIEVSANGQPAAAVQFAVE